MAPVILGSLKFVLRPVNAATCAPIECPIKCIFFGFTPELTKKFKVSPKCLPTTLSNEAPIT